MPDNTRLGPRIRHLRRRESLSQVKLAGLLGISPSYLNLIEHGRRPLSAPLLLKLAQVLKLDLQTIGLETDARLASELSEAFGDPLFENLELAPAEVEELVSTSPASARAVIRLYQAYRGMRESVEGLASRLSEDLAVTGVDGSRLPSEEVSDFIQRQANHFPELEEAAESLWKEAALSSDDLYHGLVRYLIEAHGVHTQVVKAALDGGAVRRFDTTQRRLFLSESLPRPSRVFQVAHQIGLLAHSEVFEAIADQAGLSTGESRALCRVAMANYFAAAVLMPYTPFLDTAREERHDVELLGNRFGASFEQVCHRLTSLRRPGDEGVPFHFARVDIAGNISKQFSASGIQISRFGGACPRWNLHAAFLTPGQIVTQLSRMPDGGCFFCIARTVTHGARGYHAPKAVQAITLGCAVQYASQMVYADGIDIDNLDAAVPIGTTCRLCDRTDCEQRAFPPLQYPLHVDENVRGISFYTPIVKAQTNGGGNGSKRRRKSRG